MGHFKLAQSEQTKVNSTHHCRKHKSLNTPIPDPPNSISLTKWYFLKYLAGLGQFHPMTDSIGYAYQTTQEHLIGLSGKLLIRNLNQAHGKKLNKLTTIFGTAPEE